MIKPNQHISTDMAERSVLGSIMLLSDPQLPETGKIFAKIKKNTFASRSHRLIYSAMKVLFAEQSPLDMLTVSNYLAATGNSEDTGGFAYLVDLCKETPSAANVQAYVKIMRDAAIARETQSTIQGFMASSDTNLNPTESLGQLISRLEKLRSVALGVNGRGLTHISAIGQQWWDETDKRYNGEAVAGYKTGISTLDDMLAPRHIPTGSLVVLGARPKMGKTSFAVRLGESLALEQGLAVAAFSLEMPSNQYVERMYTTRANIDPDLFYKKPSEIADEDADWARVSMAIGEYNDSRFFIDDTPGISIEYIEFECRQLHLEHPVGAIVVDYLTLMKRPDAERHDLAFGEITKRLKILAKELNCIVVLLTQLNRNLESRMDKRPLPSDSRDTGQIEQDCDLWIGLYRDRVYHEDSIAPEDLCEVLVRLNRHGKSGTAYCSIKNGRVGEFLGHIPDYRTPPKKPYKSKDF